MDSTTTYLERLRVVVPTTSDNPHDINRAYDLGANSFIVKPIDPFDRRAAC